MGKSRKGKISIFNNSESEDYSEEKINRNRIITIDEVLEVLETARIETAHLIDEKRVENVISKHLDSHFAIHRQYNIGGFLGLKIDIDVNESVGIEIKLAKNLTTVSIERLLGQVIYYSKRKYNENIIVLIVGNLSDSNTRIMEELENIIADDLKVYFRYLVVSPKGAKNRV